MNKFLLISFITFFNTTFGFSQTCGNDSVVTRYETEWSFSNSINTHIIFVDSFDLTNGMVYTSRQELENNQAGTISRTQNTFVRKLLSYNAQHDTIEYLEVQGTGSGYTNLNKIEFTYTASEKPLTRIISRWNGSSWVLSKSEVWTYNGAELILNYVYSDSTGDVSQRNYSYSGNQQTSIQFQNYVGGSWRNYEQYQITYDPSGIRDSLYVQRWNIGFGNWTDSLQVQYDSLQHTATLIRYNAVDDDSLFYTLDTLNNIIDFFHIENGTPATESYVYNYFHNHLKLVHYGYNSPFTNYSNYTYDSNGLLMREDFYAVSNMGSTTRYSQYDSLSNLLTFYSSSGYMNGDNTKTHSYTYSSADHINLSYVYTSAYFTGLTCQGDSILPVPMVAGGCGPYTFSWSPSIGLSDDSIASPLVLFKDSILYTITVTDTIGQSATATFLADPDRRMAITFDSTLCSGCPVALHATSGYFDYYWYRNDTLIEIGSETFVAVESGIYTVRVNTFCTLVSDPVDLTLLGYTRIKGHVYLDKDSDCVFNNADRNLDFYGPSPFLIKIERQNYSVIVNTDSLGNFDLPIDTGNFRISLINPSHLLDYSCPDSGAIHVYIPNYGDTISGNDFGLKTKYNCNRLRVVVSSSQFRPCENVTIQVTYFNEGSEDENNPVVNLRLPTELINISSAQSFTILPDNIYQFSLPLIQIGQHASFDVTGEVLCDPAALQNATLCIDADISPINFCSFEPDSTWDGSYVRVISTCENDSSCFKIYNINDSGSDMDSPSNWRLYADNLLIQQGTFQLTSGGDTTLCFASAGQTLRLEADQTNSFPVSGTPNANVERCGPLTSGQSYSLNYILQSAPDNSVPYHYTYCSSVRNSFDPNKKTVTPIGMGPNHITDPNERFTYRIDFQNTGTDTANSIRIIDEVSNYFDLSTIQLLASSHSNNFTINNRKLTWLFDPISLPDSNTDESNSHGYVEFSINLNSSTPNGAQITNNAQIYFDNNSVINTNTTINRICTPETPSINIFPITDLCSGRISFTSTMQYEGTNPEVKWYLRRSWFASNVDTVEFTGAFYNDIVYATLKSNSLCAISDSIVSNIVLVTGTLPTISYVWPELISSPAVSYLWFLNNVLIQGATSQTIIPVASGNYKVRLVDSTGCIFTSLDFPFVFTGISTSTSENLKVYPNPSKGNFQIETASGNKIVSVYDLTNRCILQLKTSEKNFNVNLPENISSGVYYLIVRNGENVSYERIVVQP